MAPDSVVAEFLISLSNLEVWATVAAALLISLGGSVVGRWVAERVGLLAADAPTAEGLAVGLSLALLCLAAWWAAISSGGRSAFTPVAGGLAVGIALGLLRSGGERFGRTGPRPHGQVPRSLVRRDDLGAFILGGVFVIAVAHLYGSTVALSPRDGVQPVEFVDEAFYSVLASDLAATGIESTLSPAGLEQIDGVSAQNWYHWGEIWLAAATVETLGLTSIAARHFVILPIVLLAACAMTGTLVRSVHRTRSPGAFMVGFLACAFLAPFQIPLSFVPFFGTWAVGLAFGVTQYGLAAVVVLLGVFALRSPNQEPRTARSIVAGSIIGSVAPAHIVVAAAATFGGVVFLGIRAWRYRIKKSSPALMFARWRQTLFASVVFLAAGIAWGFATDHGLGGSGASSSVTPFNHSWAGSLLFIALGAGLFAAVPIAWLISRPVASIERDAYAAVALTLVVMAVAWGARLADFNMFHLFFGPLALLGVPTAATAMWAVWQRARSIRRRGLTIALVVLFVVQIEVGVVTAVHRLQRFGPGGYEPVPVSLLTQIRALPADAKLAYSCQIDEELSYWLASLLAIGVHSDRRIVPMCFQTDVFAGLVGGKWTADEPSPLFRTSPQLRLYPTAQAKPSQAEIAAFLDAHGIRYIYVDADHPNRLVPDADVVIEVGEFQVLRVP